MSFGSIATALSTERFKLILVGILTQQISVYVGWAVSWYKQYIPFLASEDISSGLAAFIAATLVSFLIPILIILAARTDRVLAFLTELAEREKAATGISPVKQVLLTDQKAADSHLSNIVVGPEDVRKP